MAASICKKHDCLPRDVYATHLDELKGLMTRGVGTGEPQPPQQYNLGGTLMKRVKDENRFNCRVPRGIGALLPRARSTSHGYARRFPQHV